MQAYSQHVRGRDDVTQEVSTRMLSCRYSMPSMEHLYRWSLAIFRVKSQNHEKSITELQLFELVDAEFNINLLPRTTLV